MDNEGYTTCDLGHLHWGLGGAAGLMLHHQDPTSGTHRYLMQQRSPWVDHGGTWAPPSGALNPGEHPINGAMREAQEELGPFQSANHEVAHTADHGGWAFHTVTADTPHMFEPELDDESQDAAWLTPEEIDEMPLHPGFRQSWSDLRPPTQQKFAKEVWSISGEVVPPPEDDTEEPESDEQGNPIIDHLTLSSVAHNLHYKSEQGPLTVQEAYQYAGQLLSMMGVKDPGAPGQALHAWLQLYPGDQQMSQGPAVHSIESSWHFSGETAAQRLRRAQELENTYGPDTSRVVHQWPDGWSMRQLKTYADAQREGHLMGNCFGLNSLEFPKESIWGEHPETRYDEQIAEEGNGDPHDYTQITNFNHPLHPENPLYSLRDPNNLPHVSFDPEDDSDYAALGRHNAEPKPEFVNRLLDWGGGYPENQEVWKEMQQEYAQPQQTFSAVSAPALYHWTDAANLHQWMDPATTGPGSTYLTEHGNAPGDDWNPDVPQMANPVRLTIDHSQLDPQGWDEQYSGWLNNHLYHGVIPPEAVTGIKAFPAPDTWDMPEHWAKTASMQWQPGGWGKGLILDGQLHTWPTDGGDVRGGLPSHGEVLAQNGVPRYGSPDCDHSRFSDTIVINPEGYYVHNAFDQDRTPAVTRFAQAHPALKYDPRERRIWSATKFVPPLPENEGKSTEPQEVMNPWDAYPEWGEQTNDQKTHEIQYGGSSTVTV